MIYNKKKQWREKVMPKTPEYTKRAIDNYRNKFDMVQIRLEKGTKDKIKELTGKSCNAYITELVLADLARLEASAAPAEPAVVINKQTTAQNTHEIAQKSEQKENKAVDKETTTGNEKVLNKPKKTKEDLLNEVAKGSEESRAFVAAHTPDVIDQLKADALELDENGNVTEKAKKAQKELNEYKDHKNRVARAEEFIVYIEKNWAKWQN